MHMDVVYFEFPLFISFEIIFNSQLKFVKSNLFIIAFVSGTIDC